MTHQRNVVVTYLALYLAFYLEFCSVDCHASFRPEVHGFALPEHHQPKLVNPSNLEKPFAVN